MEDVLCEVCEERRLSLEPGVCTLPICDWCFLHGDQDMTRVSQFGELIWRSDNHGRDNHATSRLYKEIKHDFVVMTGTADADSGVEAVFSKERETLGNHFRKLFGKAPKYQDIQLGDPYFDTNVLIQTTTEERTVSLLSKDTVRNAILDVASNGGTVSIRRAAIDVTVRRMGMSGSGTSWAEERFANGCVLFACFARFARGQDGG